MTDRIRIKYGGDPITALDQAIRRHGQENAYLLIPDCLWSRLVPANRTKKRAKLR